MISKRFFSAFKPLLLEKIIKVPSMGESITEGSLTQWHKKIGDFVKRDEQVSTIETDKIDVQVNSPESGEILEFYAQENDTVQVGGNLFKISISDKASEEAKETKAPEPIAIKPPSAETKPIPAPVKSSVDSEYHRVPLIKFLGPRNYAHLSKSDTSVNVASLATSSTTKVDGNRIIYESVFQLPKRFRPMPYSDLEMAMINAGGVSD